MSQLAASSRGASLRCRCGKVRLQFPTPKPVWRNACCCVDCYQKN
eukprot:CAMPEP_0119294740 /NCGR_PEP_ID=MMETSP1329-20130426/48594_1 /TAXON_ID=114041 /ORGANISM="Genus nov. species nov., Strain RCC1024" /LENGTH=44 /DNA_ID= /DNA_START= /DNA_END= /DNA_ORIENTATION=